MKLISSIIVGALLIALGLSLFERPTDTEARPNQKQARTLERSNVGPKPTKNYDIYRGPNYTRRVVLSFDDCPRSLDAFRKVIRFAEASSIGLVLTPTGQCLQAGLFRPKLARRHGMYVINHTVSHPQLTRLSSSGVLKELGSPGARSNYGRPPYGSHDRRVDRLYRSRGMREWLWTVDTNDWRGKSSSEVIRYVIHTAKRRDTVLMHMQWNGFSPAALRRIKRGLQARGLRICRPYPGVTPVKLPTSLPC